MKYNNNYSIYYTRKHSVKKGNQLKTRLGWSQAAEPTLRQPTTHFAWVGERGLARAWRNDKLTETDNSSFPH